MYTPLMFAWARRLKLSEHDAADLVQGLFRILVEKLPHFHLDKNKSFRSWLKTILVNRWRNWRRKQASAKVEAGQAVLEGLASAGETPDFEEAEYRRYLLHRAFELVKSEFPATTWQACWEYLVQGRPAAEVAAELRCRSTPCIWPRAVCCAACSVELAGLLE